MERKDLVSRQFRIRQINLSNTGKRWYVYKADSGTGQITLTQEEHDQLGQPRVVNAVIRKVI